MKSHNIKNFIESSFPCQVGFIKARIFDELKENLQKSNEINHDLQLMEDNINVRIDPFRLYEKVKTIIVVIFPYSHKSHDLDKAKHVVSRSSWGTDYHIVIKEKLHIVQEYLSEQYGTKSITICDNHVLHDRHLAYLAGLGNYGKNTLLINKKYGSYFFIGSVLTDLELEEHDYDVETFEDICKECNRCLKACPTQAISENRFIDAKKCMSYQTQSKAELPNEYLEKFIKFSFGCDFCQISCVYNSNIEVDVLDELIPNGLEIVKVKDLEALSNKEFKTKYKKLGASFRGKNVLLRNAVLVSANTLDYQDLENIENIDDHGNKYLKQALNYAKIKLSKGEK